ncbi:hypothetical protein KC207_07500 [Phycicoccus sp. BSK3Z-2]|uniref:5'-3' exoribonuclease 1 SH3-like domain-containing protein n=1 Tax=Phycicoccus avicenniae TaxID=2828860 RepID=A0A941D8N9_9MICO|nr:hypothetical protein [Phycicoccus avicenniae]MBR7743133.1 hypothetical protein [Phycicoccus avicenniae]
MTDFKKGDRVFAIKGLGGGWSTTVPKGTEGTVVGVESHFLSSDTFTVKFDNDEIEEVSENDIYAGDK